VVRLGGEDSGAGGGLSTRTYCFKEFSRRPSKELSLPDRAQELRRVFVSAHEHGLVDGFSLPEMERAYLRANWLALDRYRTAYLQREFPELNLQPMTAGQQRISQYYILYFLATRMAPKLHREHYHSPKDSHRLRWRGHPLLHLHLQS